VTPFSLSIRVPYFASGKCAVAPVHLGTRNELTHHRPLTIPSGKYDHRVWPRKNNASRWLAQFLSWAGGRTLRTT
jgi:hypothetical protein